MAVPFDDMEFPLRRYGEISRAFILALILHLLAAPGLLWIVKIGLGKPPTSLPAVLECDVAEAPRAPAPATGAEAMLAQVAASVPREARDTPVLRVPDPGAVPVAAAVPIAVARFESSPVLVVPDLAAEDIRSLAALPLPPEGGQDGSTNVASQGQSEQGGRPMALSVIRPHYPYAARTRGQEGSVTVRLRVTPEGAVDFAEIARSSGVAVLDQSAITAARKATFKPAERDGRPVPADMDLQFVFRLED